MSGPSADAEVRELLTVMVRRLDGLAIEVRQTRNQLVRLVRLASVFYTAGRQDEAAGLPPDRYPM